MGWACPWGSGRGWVVALLCERVKPRGLHSLCSEAHQQHAGGSAAEVGRGGAVSRPQVQAACVIQGQ